MPLWKAVRSANGALPDEPAPRVGVREEERQMLVEREVVGGDGDDRRGHGLVEVAGRQRRTQPLLGLGRAQEEHAQRLRIGRGRPHLGEIERLDQQVVRHGPVEEGVVGARLGEELRQRRRPDAGAALVLEFGHQKSP